MPRGEGGGSAEKSFGDQKQLPGMSEIALIETSQSDPVHRQGDQVLDFRHIGSHLAFPSQTSSGWPTHRHEELVDLFGGQKSHPLSLQETEEDGDHHQ